MVKTIEGVLGPSTEFNEGLIEGSIRAIPFVGKLSKSLGNNNHGLSGLRYSCGKVVGFAGTLGMYVGYAYMIADSL